MRLCKSEESSESINAVNHNRLYIEVLQAPSPLQSSGTAMEARLSATHPGKPSGAVNIADGKPVALYGEKYIMAPDATVIRYIKRIFNVRYSIRGGAAVGFARLGGQRTPTSHRHCHLVMFAPAREKEEASGRKEKNLRGEKKMRKENRKKKKVRGGKKKIKIK
jgi:hypothetical protein